MHKTGSGFFAVRPLDKDPGDPDSLFRGGSILFALRQTIILCSDRFIMVQFEKLLFFYPGKILHAFLRNGKRSFARIKVRIYKTCSILIYYINKKRHVDQRIDRSPKYCCNRGFQ